MYRARLFYWLGWLDNMRHFRQLWKTRPLKIPSRMDMHDKSLITILGVSLLLAALAVPLALRLVPRNAVYGFRTRATMANDELWLSANAYFGRRLIVGTVFGCTLAVIACLLFPLPPDLIVPVSVLCLALPSLIATLATVQFVRRERGAR